MQAASTAVRKLQKARFKAPVPKLIIAGKYGDMLLMMCRRCAQEIYENNKDDIQLQIMVFLQTEWTEFLKKLQLVHKGVFLAHKHSPLVYLQHDDGQVAYIGSDEHFLKWALFKFRYSDDTKAGLYRKLAATEYRDLINDRKQEFRYSYMDFQIGSQMPQRVVFELFKNICPKTVKNFMKLCKGGKYKNKAGHQIGYAGTIVHRIVKDGYIQAGDISKTGAKGNYSIYEGNFQDESHTVKHDQIGILGMCKKGGLSHTNECQFYVTLTNALPFLDAKSFVAFGRVVEGMRVFRIINKLQTAPNQRPLIEVKILGSGKFEVSKKGRLHSLKTKEYPGMNVSKDD